MCFSAQASFTAAVFLGAAGVMGMSQAPSKVYWFLASIPLFFGIQQFFEGLLWLALSADAIHLRSVKHLAYAYLFFAFIFWPVWVPFSIYVIEEIPMRKKILFLILVAGCILASVNFLYGYRSDLSLSLAEYSIRYYAPMPQQQWIYLAIVTLPAFISSFRNLWQFGVAVLLAAALAYYFYDQAFVSVWCFFAAIVSIVLVKVIRDNRRFQSLK